MSMPPPPPPPPPGMPPPPDRGGQPQYPQQGYQQPGYGQQPGYQQPGFRQQPGYGQQGYQTQPTYPGQVPPGYSGFGAAQNYATFGSRVYARIIDALHGILYYLPGLILFIAGVTQSTTTTDSDGFRTTSISGAGIALMVIGGIAWVVGAVFFILKICKLIAATGQTWGMKTAGIRLISTQGQLITSGTAFLRYLVGGLISGSVCYLGYLWMLWDPMKQTWHDKIFNTISVKA